MANNNNNYMNILNPRLDKATTLQDCFDGFERKIYKNLHVATLAIYKEIVQTYDNSKGYGIVSVAPLPLEKNREAYNINAYYMDDYSFNSGELVVVIYSDLNFEKNLNFDKNSQVQVDINSPHSQMNGIVIPASKNGEAGKSAYQIAVDNGFEGDESDWLASLVGPEGSTGPEGPAGQDVVKYRHFIKLIPGPNEIPEAPDILMEVISKSNSAFTNDFVSNINQITVGSYKIIGYKNQTTYEFLSYSNSGTGYLYETAQDYGTNNRLQVSFEDYYVDSDTVSEIK